eukprot:764799-Hanusia_phi.AAC.1
MATIKSAVCQVLCLTRLTDQRHLKLSFDSSCTGRIDVRHGQPKPKGHLHWLDGREGAAVVVLVRCFGPLLQEDSSLSQPSRATEGQQLDCRSALLRADLVECRGR